MEKYYRLKNILLSVIDDVKKQDFLVYFRKMSILEVNEKEIVFGTVSTFMKDNLQAKFYDTIKKATIAEFGDEIKSISFLVDNSIDNPSNKNAIECTSFYKDSKKKTKKTSTNLSYSPMPMEQKKGNSKRYTLSNFVV